MRPARDALMQISRYGELLWVRNLRHLDLEVIIGIVDSATHPANPFQQGDPICFAPREVLDMREVERPHLTLVTTHETDRPADMPRSRGL